MYKKILLPTDGSGYAEEEALRATKLLADGGEVIILSVAGEISSSAFHSRSNIKRVNKGLYREAEENVEHMKKQFDETVNVRGMVVVGFPAESIIEVAEKENVDLIVISASGKSGLHRFILGSVTEKVLKTSEIDVLMVPSK